MLFIFISHCLRKVLQVARLRWSRDLLISARSSDGWLHPKVTKVYLSGRRTPSSFYFNYKVEAQASGLNVESFCYFVS